MNKKEILIICLIICCVFSLPAVVAASDLNTTDDVGIENSDVSTYSLPNSDNQMLSGSDNVGTFSDLQNNISGGGSITLERNYTYDSSKDSGLANGINISGTVTIDGQGKVIIDAGKEARVFNIAEGAAVTLKGITFINGHASENGGSINSHGVLTIIDCKFINNTADEHGGAIYLDYSTQSTIENCDFEGNVAGLNGGAIDWRYGSTHGKVINSTFTNNTAKRSGGAIHWSGHDGTIRDSNFTDNVATGDVISDIGGIIGGGDGGAVLWVGSNGTVDNCRFIHNEANNRGGAIFLHGNSTENCTNTTVSNSIFEDNIAGINGGAVDWQEGAHEGNIYNTIFTNNTAGSNGGAVFWAGYNGKIRNSNFTNNTANGAIRDTHGNIGDGGAIIWSGVNGTVTDCRFINNSADNRGGAVYLQNSTHDNCTNTTFSWCTFINNTAGVNGGALDWHDGADDGNVYNSTFTHNTAGSNGGAIFWAGHNGKILDSNFTSNTAKGLANDTHGNIGDGGAIIWSGINGTVDNCRFIDNEAMKNSSYDFGGRGGAVYLQNCTHGNCTNTTFTNSYFYHNIAGTNGGAIDWHDGAHDGLVEKCTFINNTAKRSGGAIFWDGHNGTVRYSKFYDNHALGEVDATSVLGPVTAGGDGGAIMWSGALGDVEYCNFVNNTAAKRGGAVFLQASEEEDSDNTTFRHSYFKNNTAGTNGGAIDWNEGSHNGLVDNVTFIDNTAMRSGGAIFWFGMDGVVNNSRFIDNHALGLTEALNSFGNLTYGGHGGAIMWTGANGTIENSTFDKNDAKVNGGAIFIQGSEKYGNCSNVVVRDSKFTYNIAGVNGGAIDWYRGALNGTVANCNFDNNTANRSGGAIFWFGINGTIVDSSFTNNRALGQTLYNDSYGNPTYGGNGGAIMWTGYHGTVKNCTFETNFAENNGGAVYLQGSDMGLCTDTKFDNCTYIDNTAGIDGGAINWYVGARNGTVSNSNFINNTAIHSGGAISWNGIGGNIRYSNFTGNKALGIAIDTDYVNLTSLSQVHEVTHLPPEDLSTVNQLYVLVTYEGKTKAKYELYVTVPDPITEYRWSKLLETYSTDPSATDWATDEYFGGNGGSIIWEGDHGIVDHCIFIESDSARRGGGVYMKGSDNITFSNCYFENSTSGTNGGGLDWLAGANYGKVINCTFNNTRAARSAGAIYYDGDYGEITNVTIINATAFGGALKESRDGKVKYAGWDSSHWDTNTTGGDAGAIMFTGDNIYVYNATFTNCTAAGRGGAVFLQDNNNVTFELCVFEENSALGTANNTWKNYKEERNDANANTKVDYRLTGHGGAIAFDVGATDGYIIDSIFNDNHAHRDGGAIYYAEGATRGIVINSTFINHTINYDGGAIYLDGTYCEIHNSTFLNNSAKDDGGAIFWQGDHGKIYNITCDLNHGLGTGAGGGSSTKGGVICLTGSDVAVEKSTFTNSYGGLLGGTIFVTGNNVNITDSVFKNSTIGISEGGALYILGDDTLIRNCTFDNCTSPSEGGTIYVLGDRAVLEDSTITNSTAINGGAIYIEGNEATITNTQISNVNASVCGGAIYVEGDNAAISVNITDSSVSGMDNYVPHIDSDYYENHIADLLNRTDEMIVFVDGINCAHISQEDIARLKSLLNNIRKAIENVSTTDGRINSTNVTVALGLLDELNETLTGINATLSVAEYKENTQALFKYAADAEKELVSLAVIDASLEIPEGILENINSMIANLDTLESQGVPIETILDLSNALRSIKGDAENIFLGNKFNLAAINLTSVLLGELNQTLTQINATLSNNALDELFKGVEDTKGQLNNLTAILGEYVVIPKAYGSGGAIYISGDGDVIRNSHISQTSAYYGGAIYISGDDATIESSDFKDINATEDGGVLYISGDGGKLYNSNFTHNFAGDDGGAIYWSGDHGTIENIICSDNHGTSFNKSSSRGGAICLTGDDVTISKSKFTYNNVSYAEGANLEKIDGGALFITGNDVTISETEFSHNNASHYGGTLYVLGNETVIDNCTIDHSNATRGGAIYVEGENATISAAFKNTNATLSGGAIYVHGENARIVDSTFDTTYAFGSVDNGGGAIMVNGNFTSIENSNFTNTHADNNHEARGGAIYIKGIATNITGSKFEHSRSNRYGGSIYINGTNTTIMGSNFTDCTVSSDGSQGGAIYVNGEYTTIIDSAFDKNTAKGEGGAIYIHGLNTTISNSTFEENSVDGNGGGAIFVNGDYATIEGSNFTKNEANVKNGAEGGAIYVNGIYTLIEGSNFADSSAKFRGGAIYIDGLNAKVKDSNFTNSSVTGGTYGSVAPQGGAIYIKAEFAVVEGSIFNHSSVSNTVGEGGAIFIEGDNAKILTSEFEFSTAKTGGALYSTGSYSTVYGSNFTDNLAELNGGAIYWYGGSSSQYNTVDGCIFTSNTAHGNTSSADLTRGGGAIYWSEGGKYGKIKNSEFYYNSVQSTIDKKVDGGAVLWDKSYHALVDNCKFVGNFVTTDGDDTGTDAKAVWAQGGAMYLRPWQNYTISNCLFENCSSSKEAGALYIQSQGSNGDVTVKNTIFKNNFANNTGHNTNGGGAVQVKQAYKITFQNVQFINNSANKGGAVSVYNCKNDNIKLFDNCTFENNTAKGTNTEIGYGGAIFYTEANKNNLNIMNSNFTYNKAERGSAIYSTVSYTLTNVELLKNRANTSSFDLAFSRSANTLDITLKGWDNRLNALYVSAGSVTCSNVTYWTNNNKAIGKEDTTSSSQSSVTGPTLEKGISITVELFDRYNNNKGKGIFATDQNGKINLKPSDFEGVDSFEEVYVVARLTNEDYYTQVVNTTRLPTEMQATAHNVTYHRNATVNVTMAPSSESEGNASGIVSVYYNDTFLGNITLADNNTGISNEISTLLGDHYLEVGTHNLTLRYWGDLYNDAVNLTVPINVTKAQSNITIIYEDMGYDLFVNVTIVDDYDDVYYKDATGNVIIEVYSMVSADPLKTAIVNLINGTGLVRIENLLPSNYTIKARYGGDHNYYPSVNSTPAEVREKADAIVDIQVSAYDIMVNETVYINITLITPDGYNATGNVTLYLNNEKYVLPLNNSKAYFNTTGLPEGRKIITVCYDGNEQLIPTSNDATFWVHKYNTTIVVNTTDITHIQHEVINITLLNDTVGVVSVFINDKEYFARISNGTAILELPLLPVGEYNVTVVFPGDDKYNNNTAYAKFNVLPATPEIVIDIENVTYGESTPVVVKLINCAEGNVSIEIDGTPYGDPKPVNNGRVEFVISGLAAGNYTLKATYSGDANHTAASAEQDFTVYKADRTVIVDVQNIVYGDDENINVHVNATGNVTVKINGKTIEDYKVLEDNSTQITLDNWAAGVYNVEVIYNGNENYTKARATATFIISPMDTTLEVQVHDLDVWNTEYINITLKNSTGDVATNLNGTLTININGVDHHAEIINGTARFNITENSVGQRVVWVFYEGDGNFTQSKVMKTYDVFQRTPSMEVIAHDITVGQDGNITVNLPANATGYVQIEVDGVGTYYSSVSYGQAFAYPKNLKEGYYKVIVRYYGDAHDNYKHVSHIDYFTVSKAEVNLTIDVNDTVYGNDSNIVVYVDNGVEGSITVKINDTLIGTYGIVDGKVNITVRLPAGNYTVHAEYGGSYGYDAKATSKDFNVAKATPVITIDAPEVVDANTNATIIVRINETATGNITITVNGTKYNATIENGVAVFVIDKLLSGKYNITAEYVGDNNYTAADTVTLTEGLTVDKVSCYQINVTANDTKVGWNSTIIVKVPADAVGNVSIYVDGIFEGNATISQGVAQLNVTRPYGNHTVNATFTDAKYGFRYAIADFWVFKHESPLVIDADSILVGDVAYINVTAPSDNVTIEINGNSYNRVRYENGVAYFEVSGLEHGNKTVVAIYAGNEKYLQNTTTKEFIVSKRSSQVNLTVNATTVGNDVIINVTIPSNATGYVIVVVDGQNYSINTTGGVGSVRIAGLGNITHYVNVTYVGDEQYLSSSNSTNFTVNKVSSTISVAGENITLGDAEVITITVPVDATGNVTVVIVDVGTYTVSVANGTGILVVNGLDVGTYTVNVEYNGDGKYMTRTNSTTFKVSRVNMTEDDITVIDKGNGTVVVVVPGNATGNVTIKVGNNTYVANVTNGTAVIDLVNETPGEHNITVIYSGDGNYTNVTVNSTVVMPRIVPTIRVNVNDIYVGDVALINVTLPVDATGTVTIEINGKTYTPYEFTGGIAKFRVENLTYGVKTVAVVYSGDHNYTGISTTANFTVYKRQSGVNVTVNATTVGNDVIINVTIPSNATGYVIVVVDGQNYSINTTGGVGSVRIAGLGNITHYVNVTYVGDEQYLSSSNSTNFTVNKVSSTISVAGENITLGDAEVITITVPVDATGNVTVVIVDVGTYTVSVSNGTGILVVKGLDVGTYTVNVEYNGDGKYMTRTNSTTFKVSRVNMTEEDITVIDKGNGTVVVVVPGNATGNVTIKVGNNTYVANVTNGTATIDLVNETPGEHNITVIYSGDGNYTNVTVNSTVVMPRIVPTIRVNVTDIYVGDVALVNVTLPVDATGTVIIEINGKTYTPYEFIGGIAKFRVENLTNGVKTVAVVYSGDHNYTDISTTANFTVYKRQSSVNVTVNATTVGKDVIINVTIPSNATGYVIVVVDGQNYSINTTGGIGSVRIAGLGNITHYVNVTYIGDEQYLPSSNSTNFTVNKVSSTISVVGENITLGDAEVITITVPVDATGNVTVEIVDVGNYTVSVSNGTGSLVVKDLGVGTYTVNVEYNGDGKYLTNNNHTEFTVSRVNTTADDIKVIDQGNGTVVVVVPGNATGNVTIKVGNNTYVANVTNGTAVIDLVNEIPGTHNITVIYSGDGNYTNATLNSTVTISKMTPAIKVNVTDIYVGDVALINVTLPVDATGTVTIEINGKTYTPYEFTGGIARFKVENLTYGVKTVAVVYSGDHNYTDISTTANFTVYKRSSQVNLTVNATTVGKDVIINVTIPSNATGYVIVVVDGQNYSINTTGGIGSLRIAGLGNTTHNVNVTYLGDEQYLSSSNGTDFTVDKVASTVSVKGENITLGDREVITITVPVDATGNVAVEIVDVGNYTVSVSNGTGILVVKGLAVGTYTVNVEYNGDGKYLTRTNSTTFKVSKVNTTADDIKVIDQGNGTVVVIVPENATGNVTITVGNHTYVANVTNGTAVIDLVNETPGTHDITVIYSGDGNYTNATVNATVTIPKLSAPIKVNVTDIYVGDVALINVTLPADATGTVTIEINGETYAPYEFTGGIAKFRVENLTYGVKTAAVKYSGDANYTNNFTTANFTVSKRQSYVKVNVSDIDVGQTAVINVTIPENATGQVIVSVGGTNYTINMTTNTGSIPVKCLASGEYNLTVTYMGDDQYLSSTNTTVSFTVSKLQPEFTVNGTEITYGEPEFIKIQTDSNITGKVKVEIDGKNYTAFVNEGIGNLTVEGLKAGNHNVTLYFEGNYKYLNATANNTFTVNKAKPSIVVIPQNITFGDREIITVYVNATGTVSITVDDITYSNKKIIDGKVELELLGYLCADNYTAYVVYNGNENYTTLNAQADFTVAKRDPSIRIVVQNITYGDVEHIIVYVNASGNVTIRVNGTEENIILKEDDTSIVILRMTINDLPKFDGRAHEYLYNLNTGVYPVEVIYHGNENYNEATADTFFTVSMANTTISIEADDIQANGRETINVTLGNPNATGVVVINVDGINYTRPIVSGIATLVLDNVDSGNHSVVAIYEGNNNVRGNWTSARFSAAKQNSEIKVKVNDTKVGETETIVVELPQNATGFVIIDVDGTKYHVDIPEGARNVTLEIDNLKNKTYTVTAQYSGNEYYEGSDDTASFNVSKVKPEISLEANNITYGDAAVINITAPEDLVGNVTVTVNGKTYTVNVLGGHGKLVIPGLAVDNYTVEATFNGSDKYEPVDNTTKFSVSRMNTVPEDIKVIDQGNGTVVVVVPGNDGNVTVKVGNNTYVANVTNGTATIDLVNETPGKHNITVIYSGDGNYTSATVNASVVIPKLNPSIKVNVTDIYVGDVALINVTLPDDAEGNVTIEINGETYTPYEFKDGVARFRVSDLAAGVKTVAVVYSGDDNYTAVSTTANFTVSKRQSGINVTVNATTVGNDVIINVTIPSNATGYVIVKVDGQNYSINTTSGVGSIRISGLGNTTHDVSVTYLGDEQYLSSSNGTSFTVDKVDSTVSVVGENITYGDREVITVTVPADATGNVTVEIVNVGNYTVSVANGTGILVVKGLDVGTYTVNVKYNGDGKYLTNTNHTTFTVSKVKTTEDDIKVIDQGNGTVVVVVPGNATGNVTIKVGNNTYVANVTNGTAVVNLDNVTPGEHTAEVIYSGDDTHSNSTVVTTVICPKYETPMDVTTEVTKVGDIAIITVNVPENATGNVTIEIDGIKHSAEIKDGFAVFEVENLTEGTKTIAVEYPGDDNYAANYTIANITMVKRPSWVNATIEDIDVGENVLITVHVPENATGQVLIDIDGVGYYVNVTGGVGTTEIPRMPNGIYNVNLTYTGDGQYLPSNNVSSFNVSKVPSFVIPIAENITVGENEIITFIVPEDATGNITIIIDGDEYNFNLADGVLSTSLENGMFITAVSGGKGKIGIFGLPKGNYTVTVRYNGDGKYLPSDNATSFKVSKSPTSMEVIDLGNGTVLVQIGDNASGNVTVKIGNQTYNATVVNGTAIVPLTNATPGTHEIEVTYSGDDTHGGKTVESSVTIPKYNTPISVDVQDIYVGDTAVVTVTLPDGATGTVTIEINGKTYSTDKIVNGKAVFNVPGLAFGDKTVAVKYSGDDNYEGNYTTGKFTVKKRPSTITANPKNIKVGQDEVITVTVPSDATGKVCIKINGVGYYGDIVNGKAKIVIPDLPAGKYKATVTYDGDGKYLPSSTTVSFTVSKSKTSIKATGDEIIQGEDAKVVIKLPKDATGKVTIKIAGKKYTAYVKNGKAVFKVPGLSKGKYKVKAHYPGDKKYDAIDTVTKVIVHKDNRGPDHGDKHSVKAVSALQVHQTGNPIWLLLLVILAVGLSQIRRFRK